MRIVCRAMLALGISTCLTTALDRPLVSRAVCTRSTTAENGDTCASMATREGVTVADIIKYNPSITSCSKLTTGETYCLEMTDSPGASSSATSPSTPAATLKPSVDGDCGNGVTCIGSKYGDCCSEHGYCGRTDSYCNAGCQSAFGLCGRTPDEPGEPTPTLPSSTSAKPSGGSVTSTIFQTVLTTVTVTSTSRLVQPTTSVVLTTSVKTSTRLVTQTTTSILVVTSTITTIKTISSFAAGCGPAPTSTPGVPTPTLPNTASNCEFDRAYFLFRILLLMMSNRQEILSNRGRGYLCRHCQ